MLWNQWWPKSGRTSVFFFEVKNNKDQETIQSRNYEPQKKSPASIRRNALKEQNFLDLSSTPKLSECLIKCELCKFKASCNVTLRNHMQKEHSAIPQLDGQEESYEDHITGSCTQALLLGLGKSRIKMFQWLRDTSSRPSRNRNIYYWVLLYCKTE